MQISNKKREKTNHAFNTADVSGVEEFFIEYRTL
jgi:hypothetical protein